MRSHNDRGRRCTLCKRIVSKIYGHHAKPKKFGHSIKDNKIKHCIDCERTVHSMFKLKELETEYNTVEKLLATERIQKYVAWVKDKPEGIVKHPKRMWKGGKYE